MDQDELRRKLMEFIEAQGGKGAGWGRGRTSRRGVGGGGGRSQGFSPRPMPMLGRSPFSRQLSRGIGGLMAPSSVQGNGTPGMGGPPPGQGVPNVPNPGIRPTAPSLGGGPSQPGYIAPSSGDPLDSPSFWSGGLESGAWLEDINSTVPDYSTDPQLRQQRFQYRNRLY
jgi:hypothetical protein